MRDGLIDARPTSAPPRRRMRLAVLVLAVMTALGSAVAWMIVASRPAFVPRQMLQSPTSALPLAFTPDGTGLLTLGGPPRRITLWDLATGKERGSGELHPTQDVVSAMISRDGRNCVVIGRDYANTNKQDTIECLELPSCRSLGHVSMVRSARHNEALISDGTRLRVVRQFYGPQVEVIEYELGTLREVARRQLLLGEDYLVALTQDGRFATSIHKGALTNPIVVFDLDEGREVAALKMVGSTPVSRWQLEEGGRSLAIGRLDGCVELWDIRSGRVVARWQPHSRGLSPTWLMFSPDGSLVASDAIEMKPPGLVRSFARFFARRPGSRRLVVDELVFVDRATGRVRGRLGGAGLPLFSPDGRTFAVFRVDNDGNGSTAIYDVPPAAGGH